MMMMSRIKGSTAVLFFIALAVWVASLSLGLPATAAATGTGNDTPPVVKINAPANNSSYNWNSLVNYSVMVTFNGKSTQYQEIPSNEVLLKATYIADTTSASAQPAPAATPAGLLEIIRSNCMGCHQFKAKAMGPSFAAIAQRYPDNPATLGTLSRYIHEGSTGVFGQASMPPHPEFTEDQLHAIVHWIAKEAANPNVTYYVGTEGAFRMEAAGTPGPTAGIAFTASYTSPSPAGEPAEAQRGEATVIVRGK